VSATAEPDTPPKNMLTTIFTAERPPGKNPTRASAKATNLFVTPPFSIICPANIKNGMARRSHEFAPAYILWITCIKGVYPSHNKAAAEDRARANDTGTFNNNSIINVPNNTRVMDIYNLLISNSIEHFSNKLSDAYDIRSIDGRKKCHLTAEYSLLDFSIFRLR
jgi:hypothetical protein